MLLQRFLTGLCPEIGRQLLLRTKPTDFPAAVKTAVDVEYALQFDGSDECINAIRHTTRKPTQAPDVLCQSIETLTKRLESLEATMQKTHKPRTTHRPFQGAKGFTPADKVKVDIAEISNLVPATTVVHLVTCIKTAL